MAIYYSPTTDGFYLTDELEYTVLPEDAFEVSKEQYNDLMAAQNDGRPIAYSPVIKDFEIFDPATGSTCCHFVKTKIDTIVAGDEGTRIEDDIVSLTVDESGVTQRITRGISYNDVAIKYEYLDEEGVFCLHPSYYEGAFYGADLGTDTLRWKNVYAFGVDATNITHNGTEINSKFGSTLTTTDNKRITLRAPNDTGLSNFDPAAIVTSILQGMGYGSTSLYGKVGAIALAAYDNTDGSLYAKQAGEVVAGSKLRQVSVYFDGSTYASEMRAGTSSQILSGTWRLLTGLYVKAGGFGLVLAVRMQ